MGSKITICGSKLNTYRVLATKSKKSRKYQKFSIKFAKNQPIFPNFREMNKAREFFSLEGNFLLLVHSYRFVLVAALS